MTNDPPSDPTDVRLLLRSHAEARWLSLEVVPVVRELERDVLSPSELAAALAYLEVLWIEARRRATDTDATRIELDATSTGGSRTLYGNAHRYHAAVRRLRAALAGRVQRLLAAPAGASTPDHASW